MATAMTTAMKPRRPARARPADTVRLTVHVNGVPYAARPLPVEPGSGVARLVRLRKLDGDRETYYIHRDDEGRVGCDCADFEFRHVGTGTTCKHGRALAAVGLL